MMMTSERRIQLITNLLQQKLAPTFLEVLDESHRHHGHPGAQSGAGHFKISIASPQFVGQNNIASHRLIYAALKDLIGPEIHALRICVTSSM